MKNAEILADVYTIISNEQNIRSVFCTSNKNRN